MADETDFKHSIHSDMIDSFNSFGIVLDFLRVVDLALTVDASPNEVALATVLGHASATAQDGRAAVQRVMNALRIEGQAHG